MCKLRKHINHTIQDAELGEKFWKSPLMSDREIKSRNQIRVLEIVLLLGSKIFCI